MNNILDNILSSNVLVGCNLVNIQWVRWYSHNWQGIRQSAGSGLETH